MLNGIQIIRGLAAMMVVMFHLGIVLKARTGTDLTLVTIAGESGVDLFFTVSGFILIYATAFRKFSPRDFIYRRATRVVPLYWLMTLLFGLLILIAPVGLFSYRPGLTNFLTSFVFIPTYNFKGEIAPPLNQGWTLAYEMFFYVTLTVASMTFFKARIAVMAILFSALIAAGLVFPSQNAIALTYSDPILLEFVMGCVVAELLVRDRLRFGPRTALALIAVGLVALASGTVFAAEPRFRALFWGVPSFLIVLGTVRAEQFIPFGRWRVGRLVGDSSYSIYLSHTFVLAGLSLVFRFGIGHVLGGLPAGMVIGVACVLVGILCWRYVERPLTDLLSPRKRSLSWTGSPAPAATPTPCQAD